MHKRYISFIFPFWVCMRHMSYISHMVHGSNHSVLCANVHFFSYILTHFHQILFIFPITPKLTQNPRLLQALFVGVWGLGVEV